MSTWQTMESVDFAWEGAAQQLERTAAATADALRLAYGEMTAQEIRTVRAVLKQQATVIRSLRPLPVVPPLPGESNARFIAGPHKETR